MTVHPPRKWMKKPKTEEPPPNAMTRRPGGYSQGKWWYFLEYCVDKPRKFHRCPWYIPLERSAKQYASNIRHFRQVEGDRQPGRPEDGEFEAYYGVALDDFGIEHWYVWVKWIPNKVKKVPSGTVVPTPDTEGATHA